MLADAPRPLTAADLHRIMDTLVAAQRYGFTEPITQAQAQLIVSDAARLAAELTRAWTLLDGLLTDEPVVGGDEDAADHPDPSQCIYCCALSVNTYHRRSGRTKDVHIVHTARCPWHTARRYRAPEE